MGMLDETRHLLTGLLESQRFAVVASQSKGQPHCSLVAFASSKDRKLLFFATPRYTRKYSNLLKKARSTMLIDNRSNKAADISEAVAVTAIGNVRELKGSARTRYLKDYLAKHPHMKAFATSPSCSILAMEVERYCIVSKFQNVIELDVKQ
jgi:nitroimidazol reductase NimA-like FMN-containing flavoprotein (pyridoxamine 5'-phosphate oxidase superfamily)